MFLDILNNFSCKSIPLYSCIKFIGSATLRRSEVHCAEQVSQLTQSLKEQPSAFARKTGLIQIIQPDKPRTAAKGQPRAECISYAMENMKTRSKMGRLNCYKDKEKNICKKNFVRDSGERNGFLLALRAGNYLFRSDTASLLQFCIKTTVIFSNSAAVFCTDVIWSLKSQICNALRQQRLQADYNSNKTNENATENPKSLPLKWKVST